MEGGGRNRLRGDEGGGYGVGDVILSDDYCT